MVGIVIVSHSEVLADGVTRIAREMASSELKLEAAGGTGDPDVLGTDATRVLDAVQRAMSPDGVLVMMDLGSALMSAELAVDLLGETEGPVKLSAAPLVEGAVAAAVAASSGAPLEEVAAQARGAITMKTAQIDDGDASADSPSGAGADSPQPSSGPVDATAELPVPNKIGLHARPAARFVDAIRGLDATVMVAKSGSGRPAANAASLTNLVALGARMGDVISVGATGPDAEAAISRLVDLAATGYGDGVDQAAPNAPATATAVPESEPEPQQREVQAPAAGTVLHGIAVSTGIAVGPVHRLGGALLTAPPARDAQDPAAESARLHEAISAAKTAIGADRDRVSGQIGKADAEIFDAHLTLLEDSALLDPARSAIAAGQTAESAWFSAAQQTAELYRSLDDPLLRERATDVLDVGRRVIQQLTGDTAQESQAAGIVIADELTPAQTVGLDLEKVTAIATARGSATAHAAILARSIGLPAVLGIGPEILALPDGTELLIDGQAGTVTVAPSAQVIADAETQRAAQQQRAQLAASQSGLDGALSDGTRVEVFANIGSVADANAAVSAGAEGVGLLRTEFLFLGRSDLPGEDEQTQTLLDIGKALDGRPLVVRTMDVGADKPLAALPMPAEENPFLGMRGIRLSLMRSDLLSTQYRAILRAAQHYPIKVMMPMVATLGEIQAARTLFDQARSATGTSAKVEFGVMVEVPGTALAARRIAPYVDFFSIGSNDLTQYTMAAERGDARLASLLQSPQPPVLKLIRETVDGGRAHGCWTGVCGEMAGDPAVAILLAGLGVAELSMSAPLIPEVKLALRGVDFADAAKAAAAAIESDDPGSAREHGQKLIS